MLKKYLNGQTVSATTKTGTSFNGYISEKNGEKIVINESRKWISLNKLSEVKLTGKKLNEELEDSIDAMMGRLDVNKISSASTTDKDKITQAIISSLGDDAKKNETEVKSKIDAALLQAQVNSGTSSETKILTNYLNDKAQSMQESTEIADAVMEDTLESYDYTGAIQDSLYDADLEILNIISPYVGTMEVDELVDMVISAGVETDRYIIEETINSIIYDQDNVMIDNDNEVDFSNDIDLEPPYYNDYSDEAYEASFDDYYSNEEKPSDEGLFEFVCDRFGFDETSNKQALKETNGNIIDALCLLAESKKKLTETSTKGLYTQLAKLINNFKVPVIEKGGNVIGESSFLKSIQNPNEIYISLRNTIGQAENGLIIDSETGRKVSSDVAASNTVNSVLNSLYIKLTANQEIIKLNSYISRSKNKEHIMNLFSNIKRALAIQLERNGYLQTALSGGNSGKSLANVYQQLFGKAN